MSGPEDSGTILLTGASGFIGGRLAARLAAHGQRLRCLVRATSDTSQLRSLTVPVEVAVGDLTDPGSLERAVRGVDRVVHCAAMVSDWGTVEEIRAANATASADLGRAAAAAGVTRFVHISTTDVYGYPGGAAVPEMPLPDSFANWYSQTKREAEVSLGQISAETGMDLVILRPASVYGPGSIDVVGELVLAMRGGYLPLINRGRAVAGLVHVDNVVDAIELGLDRPEAVGESFNVTDELPTTWRQFLDDLATGLGLRRPWLRVSPTVALGLGIVLEGGYRRARRLTGIHAPPLLSRQAVQVLALDQDFSSAKLRATLGWGPRVGYEDGLAATVAWLRDDFLPAR